MRVISEKVAEKDKWEVLVVDPCSVEAWVSTKKRDCWWSIIACEILDPEL